MMFGVLIVWRCLRCGHVSEETKSADWASAWGILIAVFMSIILGFGYCVALLFSIQVILNASQTPGKCCT